MPLYFFDLWDGQRLDFDDTGVERRGPEDAFEEAVRGSRDMLHDVTLNRQDVSGWAYQVRDEAGKTLFTVPFSIARVDQHYERSGFLMEHPAIRHRKGPHLSR